MKTLRPQWQSILYMKIKSLLFLPILFILCLIPFIQTGERFTLHPLHIAMPGFFLFAAVCFYAKGPKIILYSAPIMLSIYALLLFSLFYIRGLALADFCIVLAFIIVVMKNIDNIRLFKTMKKAKN